MQKNTQLSKFSLEGKDSYLFAVATVAIAALVRFLLQLFSLVPQSYLLLLISNTRIFYLLPC